MDYWLTRLCFQEGLAALYCIAFLILINQFRGLLGSKGIIPTAPLIHQTPFWNAPTLFWFRSTDRFFMGMAYLGFVLSLFALSGYSQRLGPLVAPLTWFALWVIYMSFVHVGRLFWSFGWEILLLEAGFLTIFLGSYEQEPPVIVIWLLRWTLFRMMFGAGLIKLRCDVCWRNFTSMTFHYETQPLPGPLSRYFHALPIWMHKLSVLFTHIVELIVPFGLFGPQIVRYTCGLTTALFQVLLMLSGNLSWLNYITFLLTIPCLDDTLLSKVIPLVPPEHFAYSPTLQVFSIALLVLIAVLSIKPILNLCSPNQQMNASFEPFHIVNTYGAFGTVTRKRMEIIIEGTTDEVINEHTLWQEYGFKGKPGDVKRCPPQVSPYHYKLDWQMWFAAMTPALYQPWFFAFIERLLQGNREVLSLIKYNPFPNAPPKHIRARLYQYKFAPLNDKEKRYWVRTLEGEYVGPSSLNA